MATGELLVNLFVKYDVAKGVYGVRLFMDGKWTYVIIDDYVGVNEDGEALFATCVDRHEPWLLSLHLLFTPTMFTRLHLHTVAGVWTCTSCGCPCSRRPSRSSAAAMRTSMVVAQPGRSSCSPAV
jgi:hypothetical protein